MQKCEGQWVARPLEAYTYHSPARALLLTANYRGDTVGDCRRRRTPIVTGIVLGAGRFGANVAHHTTSSLPLIVAKTMTRGQWGGSSSNQRRCPSIANNRDRRGAICAPRALSTPLRLRLHRRVVCRCGNKVWRRHKRRQRNSRDGQRRRRHWRRTSATVLFLLLMLLRWAVHAAAAGVAVMGVRVSGWEGGNGKGLRGGGGAASAAPAATPVSI